MVCSGHVLSENGLKIDHSRVKAMQRLPELKSVEIMPTFLGMVTYVGKSVPQWSQMTEPLRELTREARRKLTSSDALMNNTKKQCSRSRMQFQVLAHCDVKVQYDASEGGTGCVIVQKDQPMHYASCALTPSQQAYAQIEKEVRPIGFVLQKFHTNVYG